MEQLNNNQNEEISVFEDNGKKYGGTSFNDNESVEMPQGEVLAEVNYNVTLSEEEKAFKLFQKMYVRKQNIIKTIVLGLVMAVFIAQLVADPEHYLSMLAVTVAAVGIFITWYNPVIIRKNLMKALKPLENDKYIFKLYDDAFSIETVIDESEFEEGEERISPPPRIVWREKSDFCVKELDDIFVIIMKKETIYVLPKRCMDEEKQGLIRKELV